MTRRPRRAPARLRHASVDAIRDRDGDAGIEQYMRHAKLYGVGEVYQTAARHLPTEDLAYLYQSLRRRDPKFRLSPRDLEILVGGLAMAKRRVGWIAERLDITESTVYRICRGLGLAGPSPSDDATKRRKSCKSAEARCLPSPAEDARSDAAVFRRYHQHPEVVRGTKLLDLPAVSPHERVASDRRAA